MDIARERLPLKLAISRDSLTEVREDGLGTAAEDSSEEVFAGWEEEGMLTGNRLNKGDEHETSCR